MEKPAKRGNRTLGFKDYFEVPWNPKPYLLEHPAFTGMLHLSQQLGISSTMIYPLIKDKGAIPLTMAKAICRLYPPVEGPIPFAHQEIIRREKTSLPTDETGVLAMEFDAEHVGLEIPVRGEPAHYVVTAHSTADPAKTKRLHQAAAPAAVAGQPEATAAEIHAEQQEALAEPRPIPQSVLDQLPAMDPAIDFLLGLLAAERNRHGTLGIRVVELEEQLDAARAENHRKQADNEALAKRAEELEQRLVTSGIKPVTPFAPNPTAETVARVRAQAEQSQPGLLKFLDALQTLPKNLGYPSSPRLIGLSKNGAA